MQLGELNAVWYLSDGRIKPRVPCMRTLLEYLNLYDQRYAKIIYFCHYI